MAEQNGITVKIGAETDGIEKGISDIQRSLGRLESKSQEASKGFDMSFGKMTASVAAGTAIFEGLKAAGSLALSGLSSAFSGVTSGLASVVDKAAEMETLETAFIPLLGSADAAKQRIDELSKFAASTPFELPEIAKASKVLETLTRGALATGEGLKLVGDVASATNTPFSEISTTVGRLYDGLQSGRPVGEAMARLQELGVISGDTRGQLELLSKEGKNTEAWDIAKAALSRFSGSMDLQSKTWSGMLSTFRDNIGLSMAKFGEPIKDSLKPFLDGINKFLDEITGKAAGWGQKLMDQVMNVADFLIGAFKAPMPAIEAIGAALEAGAKIAGNNFLNSLINAGKFLSGFFSSDLPGIITGVLGNSLLKAFVDSAKAFIDAIRGVIQAFETWLGDAISNVVDFFATKFFDVLGAVAQDFKSAMADPIGFVSGKLDSALGAVMENGGNAFQSSFEKGGGSALDKISAGLGAVSDEYGQNIAAGVDRAKDSFGRLIDSIEPSAQDFFGAEDAAQRATDKFGEVAAVGAKLREEFTKSGESAEATKTNTAGAAAEAASVANSFSKAEGSTAKIKQELSASAKLLQSIADAEKKETKAGKLEARAQQQLSEGNTRGARSTANRLAREERKQDIAGMGDSLERAIKGNTDNLGYRGDEGRSKLGFTSAKDFSKLNTRSQAEKLGLDRKLGESEADLRKRIDDKLSTLKSTDPGKKGDVDKPGRDGNRSGDGGKDKESTKSSLENLVEKIHTLVAKIEPKLPVAALTA